MTTETTISARKGENVRTDNLPELSPKYRYKLDLRKAATPQLLKKHPIHRWFFFPHSYSPELVEAILDRWRLPRGALLIDPFVGTGTTLLVAKKRKYSAIGFDLSPVSLLVSNVKIRDYDFEEIRSCLDKVIIKAEKEKGIPQWDSDRFKKAFSDMEQREFWNLRQAILMQKEKVRDFLLVALLRITREFSRAVADGGWLRWVEKPDRGQEIRQRFKIQVENMLSEVMTISPTNGLVFKVSDGDARKLKLPRSRFDGLITSPPYPNRHDYSRIFHIELLMLGSLESEIIDLRYRTLRSHVEAHEPDYSADSLSAFGYSESETLTGTLEQLPEETDERIAPMLRGYFEDLYLSLKVAYLSLKPGARAAYIVGNVRYGGVSIPVDEILAEVGKQAGFSHYRTWVIRLRGNSAQQMGSYGRVPSRESVVFLKKSNGD